MLIETIGEGCRGQKVGSVERMTADPGQVVAWGSDLDDSDDVNGWVMAISKMDAPEEFKETVDRGDLVAARDLHRRLIPAVNAIMGCYRAFEELDATMLEINPLVVTAENNIIALDAKFGFDDNAATCAINNANAFFHLGECCGIQHAEGFERQGDVQSDVIALREQLI